MPRLETNRLRLRALTGADGDFIGALISDPQVRRFLGGPVPAAQHAQTLARYLAEDQVWCVCLKETDRPIGLMSLSPHHDGAATELSFQLLPEAWGAGYGTEAAGRIIAFAFATRGLPSVIAETQTANNASRRLLERIGMRESRQVIRFGAAQTIYGMLPPLGRQNGHPNRVVTRNDSRHHRREEIRVQEPRDP